jgi:hypothetical protein
VLISNVNKLPPPLRPAGYLAGLHPLCVAQRYLPVAPSAVESVLTMQACSGLNFGAFLDAGLGVGGTLK